VLRALSPPGPPYLINPIINQRAQPLGKYIGIWKGRFGVLWEMESPTLKLIDGGKGFFKNLLFFRGVKFIVKGRGHINLMV